MNVQYITHTAATLQLQIISAHFVFWLNGWSPRDCQLKGAAGFME